MTAGATRQSTHALYYPALDGLRALAIVAVFLYHADVAWMPGGLLGVDLFFVISGCLITGLLREATRGDRQPDLGAFWQRRAWRLVPAQWLLLLTVCGVFTLLHPDALHGLRDDVLATLFQVENWNLIWREQSYFEQMGRPSPLRHFWSLGMEAQFYLLWPLSLRLGLGRASRGVGVTVCGSLALASAAWMAVLYDPTHDPSRVYFGFDTHSSALWIGAATAFVVAPFSAPRRHASTSPSWMGWLALGLLVGAFFVVSEVSPWLYRGGLLAVALLSALTVRAAIEDRGAFQRVLSTPLARWLGERSYSVYLWHWPIMCVTLPRQDVPLDGAPLLGLRIVLTLLCAELGYRWVERPLRRGAWVPRMQQMDRALGVRGSLLTQATLAIGAGALVAAAMPRWQDATQAPPAWASAVTDDATTDDAVIVNDESVAERAPEPEREAAPDSVTHTGATTAPVVPAPAPRRRLPRKILSIGDSVMLGARRKLRAKGVRWTVDAAQGRQASDTLTLLTLRENEAERPSTIIHIGNNGTLRTPQLEGMLKTLRGSRDVVLVNTNTPRRWRDANNQVIEAVVAAHRPWVQLADWVSHSAHHPEWFRADGLHLTEAGADAYARFLIDVLTTPKLML